MIDDAQIEREKNRLPFGWGRFGKSIEAVAELGEPDEELVASCVGLNPTFQHRSITLAGGLRELGQSTNVVLAATNKRLIVMSTGFAGGSRSHAEFAYEGLEVTAVDKHDITLKWPEGSMHVKGCAKQMLPELAEAIRRRTS
jgi:hypothetical protein